MLVFSNYRARLLMRVPKENRSLMAYNCTLSSDALRIRCFGGRGVIGDAGWKGTLLRRIRVETHFEGLEPDDIKFLGTHTNYFGETVYHGVVNLEPDVARTVRGFGPDILVPVTDDQMRDGWSEGARRGRIPVHNETRMIFLDHLYRRSEAIAA